MEPEKNPPAQPEANPFEAPKSSRFANEDLPDELGESPYGKMGLKFSIYAWLCVILMPVLAMFMGMLGGILKNEDILMIIILPLQGILMIGTILLSLLGLVCSARGIKAPKNTNAILGMIFSVPLCLFWGAIILFAIFCTFFIIAAATQ
ncbi:Hypothetical protein PBC10988_17510 [Planctomycetales bacterium 10988]|nr:Hypothetical protein PBC10988_17510 [Planctomycetales bacterium 10988]